MKRSVVAIGLGLSLAGSTALAGEVPPANQPDISGVFMVQWGGGRSPGGSGLTAPLTPEAKAIMDQRISSQKTATPWADTGARCLPPGMPRLSLTPPPYPFEILQTAGKVVIVSEASAGISRYIYLNRGHLPADDIVPSFNGDSIGRWEGDTLVVDTIGVDPASHTIEKNGMPILGDLHIVERIRRIAPNQVENVVTIEDPKTFTQPWTQRVVYVQQPPGAEIKEYVCESNLTAVDANGNMTAARPAPGR